MRVKNALQRWRLAAVSGLLVCVGITSIGIWRATAGQKERLSDGAKQSVLQAVQKGLGHEVYFATHGDSAEQIVASVQSVDSFIHARSNMIMSPETKERLARMEEEALTGVSRRIHAEDLSVALADTLTERFSELTDQDIDYVAKITQRSNELLVLRKNGDHATSHEGFVAMARGLREQSRRSDKATRDALLTAINEQLADRLELFQEATPEKFSHGKDEGITPLQALVITYSIAADDDLAGSRDELNRAALSGSNATRAKAYGSNGRIFSSPIKVLFNKKTMTGLLERLEKGGR